MKYTDITKLDDVGRSIEILKAGKAESKIDDYKKQFGPELHETLDKTKRPDKPIKGDSGQVERMERVNRLAFPLQKRIVNSTVAFTFGNPVKLICDTESETGKSILNAVQRILKDNKIDSFNRRVARELARSTETAECWFPVQTDESHSKYGFDTKFKIRSQLFSPWNGDILYPYFDETGDMIAFSRSFSRNELVNGSTQAVKYFETYTDEETIVWKQGGAGWEEIRKTPNVLKKIPVVYGRQEHVEWHDVQWSIERLEYLLSNFADTNDYHASPKIFVQGEIKGFAKKGESGAIIQGETGSKAEYLSWDHAPESIKLEIETLLRFIYSFTQTPDISFDSVKGLQEISGEALKMLFLDAHLKVQDKREVFDEYLQRRLNILKVFVGTLNTSLKKDAEVLEIEPEIVPFMVNDMKSMIDNLITANGGKALISQRTAIAQSGLVDDVNEEYDLIKEETKLDRSFDVLEPTGI